LFYIQCTELQLLSIQLIVAKNSHIANDFTQYASDDKIKLNANRRKERKKERLEIEDFEVCKDADAAFTLRNDD
jgi:hypothetical protein